MKQKNQSIILLFAILITLAACTQSSPPIDQQATIDAAIAATQNASQNTQATVDSSVRATVNAQANMNSAIDQAVQATLTAQPAPDYATLSEEELAALIDQAVAEALAASETASSNTTSATSDGTITNDEVTYTYTYVYDTYYAIAYAEELIAAYYDYYGIYAETALGELQQIEEDLAVISASMSEIASILEQGADAATAAVDQLNAAAEQARTQANEAQAKAENWQQQVQSSISEREDKILNLTPSEIADDKIGALTQAYDFLEAFKSALNDGKFSPEELRNIGQLSANVRASFEKLGGRGGEFGNFQGAIENLTRQAARGDWGGARSGVGDFERSLPTRPSRPSRP